MGNTDQESTFTIEPLGETMLVVRFGDRIDHAVVARVHAAMALLHGARLLGVTDVAPAYATLAVAYAPDASGKSSAALWRERMDALRTALDTQRESTMHVASTIEIPVCYGGVHGPDLGALASHCGLDEGAAIARHAGGDYRVAMLGFAPGFAYLLGLDPSLHMPRRAQPRLRVPRGSVAIGGAQTGVYPSELPGGWQLIGRTPLTLFEAARDPPSLLSPGDRLRFRPIDEAEFVALSQPPAR